jgi:putative transposase
VAVRVPAVETAGYRKRGAWFELQLFSIARRFNGGGSCRGVPARLPRTEVPPLSCHLQPRTVDLPFLASTTPQQPRRFDSPPRRNSGPSERDARPRPSIGQTAARHRHRRFRHNHPNRIRGTDARASNRYRQALWSPNHGAVSLRTEEIPKVSDYVDRQETQHASERLSEILERYEILDGNRDPQLYHELFYHFSWATLRRETLLRRSWQMRLLEVLAEEVSKREGTLIAHNSMPDHIHLLVQLPPTVCASKFIGAIKGGSSHRIHHEIQPGYPVKWQQGYGVVSVRRGDLVTVTRYIENQEEHHREQTVWAVMEKLHAL